MAVGKTNPKWLTGVVNFERGGNCVYLADENTIGTSVGSGGERMNFKFFIIGATDESEEVEEAMI